MSTDKHGRPLRDRLRRRFDRQIADPFLRSVVAPLRRLENRSRDFNPVFVAGAMGSGTSLAALALAEKAECAAVIYESALQVTPNSFLRVAAPERYDSVAAYGASLRVRDDWSVERGRADLLHLYRSHARGTSNVVIDKGPNTNLVRAGFLARCFPDSKFVLVVRDPVANVEGLHRKWPRFASDTLEACIAFYRDIHEIFLQEAEALGNRVLAIEYEAIVEDSETVLPALRESLGLPARTSPIRFRTRANAAGMGIRNVTRHGIGIVPDANTEALARLDRASVTQIRDALTGMHARLRERAARCGFACPAEAGNAVDR